MITVMCGLAALALSACAAPAAPSPSTAEHAETPAPGPTQALDLSCSRLIPAPVLASFGTGLVRVGIGDYTIAPPTGTFLTTARAVLANPVTPPASTTVLAALQTGYFTCTWEDRAQDLVSLSVLPDAADAYSQATVADPPLYDLAVYSGIDVGTRSFGGCSGRELESPPSPSCSLDVLAGTTWISLWTSISPSIPQSQMAAERTSLTTAARSVLAGLAEAPEYAAMPQPASRWTSVSDCRSIDSAIDHVVPGSVTSADVSSPATLDATDAYDPIFQDAILQSGGLQCGGPAGIVTVVPGASWARPIRYSDPAVTAPTPLTVAGVTGARTLCLNRGVPTCWAEGYIDHALVTAYGFSSVATSAEVLGAVAASTAH
jgi:hypothetical protein